MSKTFCEFVIDEDGLRDWVLDDWQESPVNEALGYTGTKSECLQIVNHIIEYAAQYTPGGLTHFEEWFECKDYIFDIRSIISDAERDYLIYMTQKLNEKAKE